MAEESVGLASRGWRRGMLVSTSVLLVSLGLRLILPRVVIWTGESTWALLAATLVVCASFVLAAWVESGYRDRLQAVGGALVSIGVRTGGVGGAALAAMLTKWGGWDRFLLVLGPLYLVALFVDTNVWTRDLRQAARREPESDSVGDRQR